MAYWVVLSMTNGDLSCCLAVYQMNKIDGLCVMAEIAIYKSEVHQTSYKQQLACVFPRFRADKSFYSYTKTKMYDRKLYEQVQIYGNLFWDPSPVTTGVDNLISRFI